MQCDQHGRRVVTLCETTGMHGVFLNVGPTRYRVLVQFGERANERGLVADRALCALLGDSGRALHARLTAASSLDGFLDEVEHLALRVLRGSGGGQGTSRLRPPQESALYAALVAELDGVGWSLLSGVDAARGCVTLAVPDDDGRVHPLTLTYVPGPLHWDVVPSADFEFDPSRAAVASSSTLEPQPSASADALHLAWWVRAFKAGMAPFLPFWRFMDELGETCHVLGAQSGWRGAKAARLALGNHCSMRIEPNPAAPWRLPRITLMGAAARIAPMREALASNAAAWPSTAKLPLKARLEALLGGVELPGPPSSDPAAGQTGDASAVECGICYAFQVSAAGEAAAGDAEGETPDVVCENPSCGRPYHASCLVDWMRSLPSVRQSFHTLFGSCPYCEHPLTVTQAP